MWNPESLTSEHITRIPEFLSITALAPMMPYIFHRCTIDQFLELLLDLTCYGLSSKRAASKSCSRNVPTTTGIYIGMSESKA